MRWLKRSHESGPGVLTVENDWKLDGRELVAKEIVTLRVHPADSTGRAIDIGLTDLGRRRSPRAPRDTRPE